MLSLSLCDDCHRGSAGLQFNTMVDNNSADGQLAMYVRKDSWVWVSICMHECVGRAEEHVDEVFQYTEAVRFLKGDSSSTQTDGKFEKYGTLFKKMLRKPLKSKLHVIRTISFLIRKILTSAGLQITLQHLSSLSPLTLHSFQMSPSFISFPLASRSLLFNPLICFSIILTPVLLFCLSLHLSLIAAPFSS